jgi:predicted naringenin-chalcone synthase
MLVGTYPPMKVEQTECSETLAYKIQTHGNYPEESIQHSYEVVTQVKKKGEILPVYAYRGLTHS